MIRRGLCATRCNHCAQRIAQYAFDWIERQAPIYLKEALIYSVRHALVEKHSM